jgi:ketosteroid isomerase-like protein
MAGEEILKTLVALTEAFNRGDIDEFERHLHPDLTYVVRGSASISGIYRGPKAMGTALRLIQELTAGSINSRPEVLLADDHNVMAYSHITGSRPDGRQYDNYQAYLYRFRDGKVIEGQTIPVDTQAFEEFFR